MSGGESPRPKPKNISTDLSSALFSSDEENVQDNEDWDLPKLKILEKGKPMAKSLAEVINTACTSQGETDLLLNKYKIPQNCDRACLPTVNSEI